MEKDHTKLSIVIPTLNANGTIMETLNTVDGYPAVVCDGGSDDNTRDLAEAMGATVVLALPGRGGQMSRGAKVAQGDWLLFLHADTILEEGWKEEVDAFMSNPDNQSKAAYFQLALSDENVGARRVERLANWRSHTLGLPYGDQGLLISKGFYDTLGGFKTLPLMEDVNIVRRIGRHRLVGLRTKAETSSARYERGGYWFRPLQNLTCLALYLLGVPIRIIVKLYG